MPHNPNDKRPAAVQRDPLAEPLAILGQRQGQLGAEHPIPNQAAGRQLPHEPPLDAPSIFTQKCGAFYPHFTGPSRFQV